MYTTVIRENQLFILAHVWKNAISGFKSRFLLETKTNDNLHTKTSIVNGSWKAPNSFQTLPELCKDFPLKKKQFQESYNLLQYRVNYVLKQLRL